MNFFRIKLSINHVTSLQGIALLTKLKEISAYSNRIASLPDTANWPNVERLNVILCFLKKMLFVIISFFSKKFNANELSSLPEHVCAQWKKLNRFWIEDNRLKRLPESCKHWTLLNQISVCFFSFFDS